MDKAEEEPTQFDASALFNPPCMADASAKGAIT